LIVLIILGEEYKLWSSSLCSFLQPPVTSFLFGPNILVSALFSNTLSLCSYLNEIKSTYTSKMYTNFIFNYKREREIEWKNKRGKQRTLATYPRNSEGQSSSSSNTLFAKVGGIIFLKLFIYLFIFLANVYGWIQVIKLNACMTGLFCTIDKQN
jgi:hypothetical protein